MSLFSKNPAPATLASRYLILASFVAVLIISFTIWSHLDQQQTSVEAEHYLHQARELQQATRSIRASLWHAQQELASYLIDPSKQFRDSTLNEINHAINVSRSIQNEGLLISRNSLELLNDIQLDIVRLKQDVEEIVKIRATPYHMYPAMPEVIDKMFPAGTEFVTTLQLLLQDVDVSDTAVIQTEILKLLDTWNRLISEFRAFLSYRTGVLGDPAIGMKAYASNIDMIHNLTTERLQEIAILSSEYNLDFEMSDHLEALFKNSADWYQGYAHVSIIQQSDKWRLDAVLMRKNIQPISSLIQDKLLELDNHVNTNYTQLLDRLRQDFGDSRRNMILTSLIIIMTIFAGYWYFRRGILDPLKDISQTMLAEARGEVITSMPKISSREIRQLNESYIQLRGQVVERELRLEHQLNHDQLTSISNRRAFSHHVEIAIQKASSLNDQVAIMIIGIDRFKYINETYGNDVGDKVLKVYAQRLETTCQDNEFVARISGDEFAIVISDIDDEHSRKRAIEIHSLLEESIMINEHQLCINNSIGVTVYPNHSDNYDELINHASLALMQAKAMHNLIVFYSPETDWLGQISGKVIDLLRDAMKNDQFHLLYQPQVDIASGTLKGVETLVRLPNLLNQGYGTEQVIRVAEQSGLIYELTELVMEKALKTYRRWYLAGHKDLSISINLSVTSFNNPQLLSMIRRIVAAWDIPPDRIKLEITETDVVSDPEHAQKVVTELSNMGIRISIDDFGTGYSSLQHLKNLPVDEIKIDRSYIISMLESKRDMAFVQTMIDFAYNLDINVVAEGVEDELQLNALKEMGCNTIQGYYFARPASEHQMDQWLKKKTSNIMELDKLRLMLVPSDNTA